MPRRSSSFLLACSMSLAGVLTLGGRVSAQEEKAPEAPQDPPAAAPATPVDGAQAPAEAPAATPAPAVVTPPPPPTVPPEVEAKLEAARRAVAEAIVAAQDAGLVDSSINPPPILDILINGYANDAAVLRAVTTERPEAPLSPEVFGAWFTGYGVPMDGIKPETNVKIVPPSQGLKAWYDKRAAFLNRYINEIRSAQPAVEPAATEEPKPEAAPETTPEEPKVEPAPETTPEEPKVEPAPETTPEEPKVEPAPETTPEEPKVEPAPETTPEEPKTEEPK